MIPVLIAVAAGMALATVGAYALARLELSAGSAPRLSVRLVLCAVQVYLSTWTVTQVAADVVLGSAALDADAAELARGLVRLTLAAVVVWMPFALANLVIAALVFLRGRREQMAGPLFAAATYAVALLAVVQSGWLEGPLGE